MSDRSEIDVPDTFPGARWLATHQATVDNVLAGTRLKRRVVSRGSRFYNQDHWPALRLCQRMLTWMRQYPGSRPARKEVEKWVSEANAKEVTSPLIVIAHTPARLTPLLAHALVGGATHEGWHTRDSRRSRLTVQEVWDLVTPRWGLVPDWSPKTRLLDALFGVVEDIKLERRGVERMPATRSSMIALQEFIWAQEAAMRTVFVMQGGSEAEWFNPFHVLVNTIRDLGLGYNTRTARELMEARRYYQPEVVNLVTTVLKPHLLEVIALESKDNLGFIRKSMDIVGALQGAADDLDITMDAPLSCPQCGADAGALRMRPKRENGDEIPNVGIVLCMTCGFTTEVELEPGESDDQEVDTIQAEGFDQDGEDEKDEDDGKQDCRGSAGSQGQLSRDEGASADGRRDPGDGAGDAPDGGRGADSQNSASRDSGETGEFPGGDDGSVSSGGSHGSAGTFGDGLPSPAERDAGDLRRDGGGSGAGLEGMSERGERVSHETAQLVLDSAESDDPQLLDARAALSQGLYAANKREEDVKPGEQPWRPWDLTLDNAAFVKPSKNGAEVDQERAGQLLASMGRAISTLRSKFRSLMRAREMRDREHGLPRGIELSERMLAETYLDMVDGVVPQRAYYDEDELVDNSVAVVVSRDQSSSTSKIKTQLDQAMLAVTEPVENIGGQVMVVGWRVGERATPKPGVRDLYYGTYHRLFGINYDVFKTFGERFANVKWRFVNTRASGGTPMADGIEYGLMALSNRNEAHRILFVVTDGKPPRMLIPIIRNQLRRAEEAGIHIVAVATGKESCPPPTRLSPHPKPFVAEIDGDPLFDDWVYKARPQDLPGPLIAKLTQILDQSAKKRGKRVRK